MGFSIGGFLSGAAEAIGGALLGRVTGGISGGGSSGPMPTSAQELAAHRAQAGIGHPHPSGPHVGSEVGIVGPTAVGPRFAGGGGTTQLVGGVTGMVARTVFGAGLAVATIAELLLLSRQNTGRPVSRKKIAAAVRHCGLDLAAQMFGLSVVQVCQIVISRGSRRGRGISAADLRRTRSTLRKVHAIQHDLGRVKAVRRHHR